MSCLECTIYQVVLNLVSSDAVIWTFIRIFQAYKYVGYLV